MIFYQVRHELIGVLNVNWWQMSKIKQKKLMGGKLFNMYLICFQKKRFVHTKKKIEQ